MKAIAGKARGIFRIVEFTNPSGATSYRVTGWTVAGERIRENYKTHDEALARKQALEIQATNTETAGRMLFTRLTPEHLKDAEVAIADLAGKASLATVARFWLDNYKDPLTPKPLSDAYAEFLAAKRAENCREDTIRNLRTRVGHLVTSCKGKLVSEILPDHLQPVIWRPDTGPRNQHNERRALANFFNWAVTKGYCQSNPVDKVGAINLDEKEPQILTLAEVQKMLEAARTHKDGQLLPYVALGLFCAIRPRELSRLTWADIDLKDGAVTIGAHIAKLRGRRTVEISKNAVEWLTPHALKRTPIKGPNWQKEFDKVKETAGYVTPRRMEQLKKQGKDTKGLKVWDQDLLRHTGISHHLAFHQHEGQTADWAGNSPTMIHKHYKGLVRANEAKAFWAIPPEGERGKVVLIQTPEAAAVHDERVTTPAKVPASL